MLTDNFARTHEQFGLVPQQRGAHTADAANDGEGHNRGSGGTRPLSPSVCFPGSLVIRPVRPVAAVAALIRSDEHAKRLGVERVHDCPRRSLQIAVRSRPGQALLSSDSHRPEPNLSSLLKSGRAQRPGRFS